MLQAIRDKAQGVFAWAMLILVGIPFTLWGIENYFEGGKETPVAQVSGHEIFERDVNRAYEGMLSSIAGLGQYDETQIRQEALNKLIADTLVAKFTSDNLMVVGDEDIRAFVQGLPYFQTDAQFDKEKYKQVLRAQGSTPAQFAEQIRNALIQEQVQRGITETAFTTHRQLEEFYRLRNQSRSIEYLTIALQRNIENVGSDEITAFYHEHEAEFVTPEKVAIQYLSVSLDDVASASQVSEDDLKGLYEEQKNHVANNERRRVSHILIAADAAVNPEEDRKAKDKAGEIYQRIIKGEDFSRLASTSSDDKVSSAKGGDLGIMSRDAMDRSFSDAAFKLAKGQVSAPVRTAFGYHLIRVTEIDRDELRSFQEMRPELLKTAQRSAAENRFYEIGQTLTEQAFEHPDSLEAAAAALNLKIQETAPFTHNEAGNGITSEAAVRDAAFSDDVLNGKNSEAIELGAERVAVLRVKTHIPSATLDLATVSPDIIKRLSEQKKREQTRKKSNELFEQAKQGASLSALAKSGGYILQQSQNLLRTGNNLPSELIAAVFKAPRSLSDAEPVQAALNNGDQIIFRLIAVKDGDLNKIDPKELEMASEYLQKKTAQDDFDGWVDQLRVNADVHVSNKKE
ncbi:peptidylprolyl isomerase [Candidatus Methylospira mobilis]|uniref:Periplasmic chaperone PpiD n=1 Tax=Candidatus Methylospira mobilis TaxID=1808979 RepID=A0A5Q0BIA5_9GAMM|nr:SurA N-terminal domain-containing protein [Candidatus Methylospira mobilis]QFY42852.1 peptidylprolyl isomerase [Candidatus Methylospira mobilis]WNV04082.1 SurA N-terminal domain-containing protein [Candidatus Methylospira mobilis]